MITFFIWFGICLVITLLIAVGFFILSWWFIDSEGLEAPATISLLCASVLLVIFVLGVVTFGLYLPKALGAETRAKVLSENLPIEVSAEDVFWADNDLKKLFYGDLRRFNVNIDWSDENE